MIERQTEHLLCGDERQRIGVRGIRIGLRFWNEKSMCVAKQGRNVNVSKTVSDSR
jgi:hypothetical protein